MSSLGLDDVLQNNKDLDNKFIAWSHLSQQTSLTRDLSSNKN